MEDGDTESYQDSVVIQDSVFCLGKWVVSMVIFGRYIIKPIINVHLTSSPDVNGSIDMTSK